MNHAIEEQQREFTNKTDSGSKGEESIASYLKMKQK
jgi:hypothetical protein